MRETKRQKRNYVNCTYNNYNNNVNIGSSKHINNN